MRSMLRNPVIAALPRRRRSELLARAVTRSLAPGHLIYSAGESRGWIGLVSDGVVKLLHGNDRGAEIIVGLAADGDLFGEEALFEIETRLLDAVVTVPSEILFLNPVTFRNALVENASASLRLARLYAERHHAAIINARERSESKTTARLAAHLSDIAHARGKMKDHTIEFELPLGQREFGSLAGVSRETACKFLRKLRSMEVLDYQDRQMTIVRPDLLERLRCGERASTLFRSTDAARSRRSGSRGGT